VKVKVKKIRATPHNSQPTMMTTMMRKRIVLLLTFLLSVSTTMTCMSGRVAAQQDQEVLTKDECKERVPYEDFATDNRIISCVRNASASCCEAMQELLGDQSPVHQCTCSNGVLEDVLDEAVPLFAKDIIQQRIKECQLPTAGDEACDGLYDDAIATTTAAGGCADEYPPDVDTQYTCADQAGFGKCEESWMAGYCLLSCEKCEAAEAEETSDSDSDSEGNVQEDLEEDAEEVPLLLEADEGEVLENGTLVLSNCTDVYPPNVDTRHSCGAQAGFGKCDESWMTGYCLQSCGKCILPTTRTVASAASATEGEVNGVATNSTAEAGTEQQEEENEDSSSDADASSCVDEYPPDVDAQYTCEDQAGFGKCDQGWMEGYCLLSCEKCANNTTSTDSTSS
jgi:hypothetical protein